MKRARTKQAQRSSRQARVRARIVGTAARPRLTVFRSNTSLFIQLIDDARGVTLASAHSKTLGKVKPVDTGELVGKTAIAFVLGKELAEKAKAQGVTEVVFDRAGFRYHGRVKAAADGARAGGLVF